MTNEDLQIPLARYRDGASDGGFESGLELALRSILVSPKFLFRFESQPETAAANAAVSHQRCGSGIAPVVLPVEQHPRRRTPERRGEEDTSASSVLGQQVRRMLADPRSEALVTNFAGQWLHIRNVSGFRPSPELLFHFDDNLRQAFARETELFFDSILRENRSVLDLLDADYTFLNERLAKHYGIPGVYGERFRRVSLPADSVRRGLLGQGSILTGTSRANRTSPVIRGKWILENIFGTPPPPPLPNVPELKEERNPAKMLPMREQMAQHRANPVCASCHAQMDELGFALENFDAIGEWRDLDAAGSPIDASAKLHDGTRFRGPGELRKVLLSHSDDFLTTVTEKLLTYALGRGLEAADAAGRPAHQARGGTLELSPGLTDPGDRLEHAVSDENGASALSQQIEGQGFSPADAVGVSNGDHEDRVAPPDVHSRNGRHPGAAVPRRDGAGDVCPVQSGASIRGDLLRQRGQHARLDPCHGRSGIRVLPNPETARGLS